VTTSTLTNPDPERLKTFMAVRGLDVPALAKAADLSAKTLYSILGGRAVSLRSGLEATINPLFSAGFQAGSTTGKAKGVEYDSY
jgi:hypothetical protein